MVLHNLEYKEYLEWCAVIQIREDNKQFRDDERTWSLIKGVGELLFGSADGEEPLTMKKLFPRSPYEEIEESEKIEVTEEQEIERTRLAVGMAFGALKR